MGQGILSFKIYYTYGRSEYKGEGDLDVHLTFHHNLKLKLGCCSTGGTISYQNTDSPTFSFAFTRTVYL